MSEHVEQFLTMEEEDQHVQLDVSRETHADETALRSEDRKDTDSHTDNSAAGTTCCQTSEREEEQQYTPREESGMLPFRLKAGVAHIKPQYLVKRVRQDSSENTGEGDASIGSQVPPVKKKRRGQNKHRPRSRILFSEQLCPSLRLHGNTVCSFGDNCRYLHDIERYMAIKPPDLGTRCHLFEIYGTCPYGRACRYAGVHLTPDFRNVTNEEIHDPNRPESTCNILTKSLSQQLRKRVVKFPRSEAYLKRLGKPSSGGNPATNGPGSVSQPLLVKSSSQESFSNSSVEMSTADIDVHDSTKDPATTTRDVQRFTESATGGMQSFTESATGDMQSFTESATGDMQSFTESATGGMQSFTESATGGMQSFTENATGGMQSFTESATGDLQSFTEESRNASACTIHTCGAVTDEDAIKLRPPEKQKVEFQDKLYLAPLTTVGNLPFRRICKELGADITCGEMAMSTSLLQGQQSEWALLRRHQSEDLFGVQVCGAHADTMTRCAELINTHTSVDFVDINVGCPIDLIFKKGAGSALMGRQHRFESIVRGMVEVLDCPLTVKMRTGIYNKNWNANKLVPKLRDWGVSLVTVHGRSREQRYTKLANWEYIDHCAKAAHPMPLFGGGDILSFEDYNRHREETSVAGIMIARGALIKPWIFTEIKEQRHWDISSGERLAILRRYINYGLEHWGSDSQGVENTRRFLLEWLSFLYRYIPVGLLECPPQKINERPPYYEGRDELETLMSSNDCRDWVKISEMLLGPVPPNFVFLPKHKANAYS